MTEQETINVGLISVGWMGKVHTRAYSAVPQLYPELGVKTRLLQAADTSQEHVQYAMDVLGYKTGTTDYREVLANPDIDVVSICAPQLLQLPGDGRTRRGVQLQPELCFPGTRLPGAGCGY